MYDTDESEKPKSYTARFDQVQAREKLIEEKWLKKCATSNLATRINSQPLTSERSGLAACCD